MLGPLIAAGVAASQASALSEVEFRDWRWERRPILVFAEEGDPRLARQLSLFEDHAAALKERRNAVVVETRDASWLVARHAPDGFTVVLVGLDGGEKFRSYEVTPPEALGELIDGMPMRRREMRAE